MGRAGRGDFEKQRKGCDLGETVLERLVTHGHLVWRHDAHRFRVRVDSRGVYVAESDFVKEGKDVVCTACIVASEEEGGRFGSGQRLSVELSCTNAGSDGGDGRRGEERSRAGRTARTERGGDRYEYRPIGAAVAVGDG